MLYIRIIAILIGFFLIGLGTYTIMYRHISLTEKEQVIDINAIRTQTREGLPAFFGALLIIAGGVLIIVQLFKSKE